MTRLLWLTAALAAATFVAGSATTNALFLSSLGRTVIEAALYGSLSIAADLAKVILPVTIGLAIAARAWLTTVLCTLMLASVIALSIVSGAGFAALTRGTISATRETTSVRIAAVEAEWQAISSRLMAVSTAREAAVIAASLEAVAADRRWLATKSCTEATGPAMRQFCADVHMLRVEQVSATERERLSALERRLRAQIETLRTEGTAGSADPQVEALATLLGVSPERLRAALGFLLAAVLELGGIVLVLLIAGPLLRTPVEPVPATSSEPSEPEAMRLPPQVDRSFWLRQRNRRQSSIAGEGNEH